MSAGSPAAPPQAPPTAVPEPELRDWGRRLGEKLQPGTVVALHGELGAGKTTLVQAICEGYGVRGHVTSPTFALIQRYDGKSPVTHIDLYRLAGEAESAALGLEELFAERALTLVEWPDRAGALIPEDALHIHLRHVDDDPRCRIVSVGL